MEGIRRRLQRLAARAVETRSSGKAKQKTAALEPRRRAQSNKLGYKEERELADLPDKLEALEREQEQIAGRLADPALYRDRSGEIKPLQTRHAAIRERVDAGAYAVGRAGGEETGGGLNPPAGANPRYVSLGERRREDAGGDKLCITGLYPLVSGEVFLNGPNVHREPEVAHDDKRLAGSLANFPVEDREKIGRA